MKIHKKDKQQMFSGLLKHLPSSASSVAASSSASEQNSGTQTTHPTIPRGHLVVGTKDQLRLLAPVSSTTMSNHCAKSAAGAPQLPSSLSEEDDGGGGGRVRKKRKKKDKRGQGQCEERIPKKQKQEREATLVTLSKSNIPKGRRECRTKGRGRSADGPTELKHVAKRKALCGHATAGPAVVPVKVPGKRGRKPKIKILPPLPDNQARPLKIQGPPHANLIHGNNHSQANIKTTVQSATKQRGRKPRDPGAVPVERKKKAKRRTQAVVIPEDAESDDTTSLSAVNTGGEDSQDPLDSTKRRSGRQVKRRKYNEDLDFKVVDDDGETIAVLGTGRIAALNATALAWQAEEPPEDEANIIEKILSVRAVKKEQTSPSEDQAEEMEEFYVKYRNFSYMHCKWATLGELEKDPRIHQKIKRFRTKRAQMKHLFTEPDEDLFNPDYIEVDRVLEVAVTMDTETGEEVTHYLVKWCSLSYEEATWELQEDLDPEKIKEFEEIQKVPADLRHVERPPPEKWLKLERSRDYRNGNELREYQLEGMNWLLFNWYNRKNCILADEMGLGKTIQSITFLYEIFSMGIRGPFLIIAPLSTITNWEREFRTWTHMNVIVYHGSQISRQMILQYEMFYRDPHGNTVPSVLKFHGLITTFEMVMADCPDLKKLQWRCVVIDEAHRLKNRNCKLLEGLKLMNLEHKVLLTGTPLQNSVEELFSLLNFLEPLQFPSESLFLEEFGDLKTDEQVKKLQAILKPMMLRRLKDDVEKNLAPKEETIIEVELTNIQKKYYRAILEKNFSFLSKGANQHNMPNLINTMMELRKCCNHPYLITGAEEKILDSFRKSHSLDVPDVQLQAMIQAAGKLVLIDKLLPKLLSGGHKVLVFSQMVRCLDILEDYLIQRRYTYERIDGRVRGNLRQAAIDRFCKPDSDRFVFLLCTRAGGLGINLTAADTCIIFDSDWNPQNDLQAQARCHRIGQSKAVKVYRLITRNSYEREMFDKASLKLGLDKAVLQDINRKGNLNGVQQLSKLEVEDLLKKGAYGALMDEEDEGSKFCEEDIDQILQRRTQTITIQSEGKGSTFAKASFISSGNRTDISLDDPNFWQKWAKIAEVEIDSRSEKESLVIDTPRVRKQTRHYNSFEDDELMEFSELDSDSEEKPCRTRRLGERSRRYLRAECFRVEKNLLIFGWGRWKDILNHGRFKWHLAERDMEAICRALLVYCLKHYKGDDKIKSFIWDLISPSKDGQDQELLNHSGLSAPVPRGRKGTKVKIGLNDSELKNADWLAHCNPEVVLQDDSYKKHLKQHCNKVLLRVRMLYYLKVEVLGEAANQAVEGVAASKLDVSLPDIDYIEIPASWWDVEADKSLLIGVHKHGYERYHAMRADPDLCFLERVGMPDVTALSVEMGGGEASSDITDSSTVKTEDASESRGNKADGGDVCDESSKGEETCFRTDASDKPDSTFPDSHLSADLCAQDATLVTTTAGTGTGTGVAALHVVHARPLWPTGPALTARLRRLITAYQRFTLRREPLLRPDFLLHDGMVGMGVAAHGPHTEGPLAWHLGEELRRCSVAAAEQDAVFLEWQRRWTRREQMDFYRTVSSFGVVYDPERKVFDWSHFRVLARLERKTDESLERYFNSFVNMCRTACKLPPRKEEGLVDPTVLVEPLTEERAARTLYRIELLRKIREQVLRHPLLSARLQLCRPSLYLPVWWESGKHDRDLLIGAARHGLSRTDFYILNEPQLSFLEAHRNYVRGRSSHLVPQSHHHHPAISSSQQLPAPHYCLYDSTLGRHSPQPPEYPHQHHSAPPSAPSSTSSSSSAHLHPPPPPLDTHEAASPGLGIVSGSRGDFLDCPPLDESLDLGSLQHDTMAADALHGGKASKDALNGFPFNSATGGQSMLNSYGVGGADLHSKLRSDVLVGEQGSSEETGLLAPSVELGQLQAPWDGTDHSSPAHHMFNESDPILGPSTLETGFLEEEDEEAPRADEGGDSGGTLEDCLGLPPSSSPSHPSAADSVESSSYMLFKDIGVSEEPGVDQNDLTASPLPAYIPPTPLSLPDISDHEPEGELSVEEGDGQEGGVGFKLDTKKEKDVREKEEILEEEESDQGVEQHLGSMRLPTVLPNMDMADPEPALREQEDAIQVCQNLQQNFERGDNKEGNVLPYLGKLEQEGRLMCPIEEVDTLMLYQTAEEEETIANSIDSEALMADEPGEFLQDEGMAEGSRDNGPLVNRDPADQVDKISRGHMDQYSLIDGAGVKVEEVQNCNDEYQNLSEDCRQNNKLDQSDNDARLPAANQCSTRSESHIAEKDQQLPVKLEETKTEDEVIFPQISLVKPEDVEIKAERLDPPLKAETLESFPIKTESSAIKQEALLLTTATKLDICEVKPEDKSEPLEFSAPPTGKAETGQEVLEADSTVPTSKLEQVDELVEASETLEVKGQVKEERSNSPVPGVEDFAGSPRFTASFSTCELPDSLNDIREPTIAQLLQEKALYSYSDWPKDRVIINRLDSICHAILKGKWPSSSDQYDSPTSLAASNLAQQHLQRSGFLTNVPGQARIQQANPGLAFSISPTLMRLPKYVPRGGGRGAWRLTSLPLLQERLVAPPYLPEIKRSGGRRSFDYEAVAAAAKVLAGKTASSSVSSSGGGDSHRAMLINGWQEAAIDLSKSPGDVSAGSAEGAAAPGMGQRGAHKLPPPPPITAPLAGQAAIDMAGILQAGLIHPVTGQIVNGSLRGDDSLRRRRGRRRNVEALYSEFTKARLHLPDTTQSRVEVISHSCVSSSTSSPSPSSSERPAAPLTPSSSSTPTPTQTPPQPDTATIEREASGKGLMEWLRQKPGYSLELPFTHVGAGVLHGLVERPKQRRHRCKDPTKLDVNTLTGDERVPVVHRGTGRRLGGAMAPAIKELSRWLDANSEYFVAPDWSDVVKHSGFLPEGKFSRILTEPVSRDTASRRRGRRPRSEMPKPLLADSSPSGLGPPLFMNGGLIGSMDSMVAMQNLRGSIPGIPISGIMAAGFPHVFPTAVSAGGGGTSAEDAKNGLSMLPMMLHGIPPPHGALFGVGAMMTHTPPPLHASHSPSSSSSSSLLATKVTSTIAPITSEAGGLTSTTPSEGSEKKCRRDDKAGEAETAAAVVTSTSRGHPSGHLSFNPFLIPGMSHGLLYPHMFLPHGGIVALPAMPPGATDTSPGSPKRRRKRDREEAVHQEEEVEAAEEQPTNQSESTIKEEDPPLPENGGAGPTEPLQADCHQHAEEE
ncbi:chromodomain-helicase-DNA-binding protein 6 isoform X5 [Nerophis lumbriciformis]|uniref:chromodomain-helicase-DNA-binding protein 6 isoform X5 n=1 Tax=Nerophis lumbriciformis TaxID=546530 RepID=UPI002ADFCC18|nr:chromodomain-helicase-DNA-binding protein 6-like isoform X5 [Nerophis lumbriciformis]